MKKPKSLLEVEIKSRKGKIKKKASKTDQSYLTHQGEKSWGEEESAPGKCLLCCAQLIRASLPDKGH